MKPQQDLAFVRALVGATGSSATPTSDRFSTSPAG
jgi:hypothetical protein